MTMQLLERHALFETGDLVRHLVYPEWGPGQVLGHATRDHVEVFFLGVGTRQVALRSNVLVRTGRS